MDDMFLRPERPFVLVLENDLGDQLINYFETEDELNISAGIYQRSSKFKPYEAFEMGSVRGIEITPE